MNMKLIKMEESKNINSKKYVFILSFFFTFFIIYIGNILFYNILGIFSEDIHNYYNYQTGFINGIQFFTWAPNFTTNLFLYFEIIFFPILFIFIHKYINRGISVKHLVIFIGALIPLLLLLLSINNEFREWIYNLIFKSASTVSVYLVVTLIIIIGIRFVYEKKGLFVLSLIGVPLYFILQLATPIIIPSEIDLLEVSPKLLNYEDFEKIPAKNLVVGNNLNSTNSRFVKKLPLIEDIELVEQYSFYNDLKLALPRQVSSTEAYYLLTKENSSSLCFQFNKSIWDSCFKFINFYFNNEDLSKIYQFDKSEYTFFEQVSVPLLEEAKLSELEYNKRKDFPNIEGIFPNRARGWFFHHHHNFESPLYTLPKNKLPNSQYSPLGLSLLEHISSTIIDRLSTKSVFSLTIGAVQLSNIIGYLIILLLLICLKIDDDIKTIISLSLLSGLVLLLETSDAFAPGLSLFRTLPQLILVILAFYQLSLKKQPSVYLSMPFVSIFVFPLLALYNEQFAIFTLFSALISLMFRDKLKIKLLTIFLTVASFIIYWSFVKEYFIYIDVESSNLRMINYILGIGWGSTHSITRNILLGLLMTSPLFYILIKYSRNDNHKVNSIFVVILSVLMFVKYIWNPSINHFASVLPFFIFPFVVLFFSKNIDIQYYCNELIVNIKNFIYSPKISDKLSFINHHLENENPSNKKIISFTEALKATTKKVILKIVQSFIRVIKFIRAIKLFAFFILVIQRIINKLLVYKSMVFVLFIIFVTIFISMYGIAHNNRKLYENSYIENFNYEEFFSFPRRVFIDSSFDIILSDYYSLVSNIDREIVLLTKHDSMISMNTKKEIGSPFSDFSANIVFQKDIDIVSDLLANKNYCAVIDRLDQFYYLPDPSETEIALLHANRSTNILSIFYKVKPALKFIDQSNYFELHCS
jgi:hypothetical protein